MNGDVRSFYAALGIELAQWSQLEAPVRCFADTDAHEREDRSPSCSVNLASGVWNCHGCGAHGGAYDAAIVQGHSPRSAVDLMVANGLAERRGYARRPRSPTAQTSAKAGKPLREAPVTSRAPARPSLALSEQDVQRWHTALIEDRRLCDALWRTRGWRHATIRELGLGCDRGLITIPIRNGHGALQGLYRYQPGKTRDGLKMRAQRGSRLGLIPHPARETSSAVVLVEGPSDMIAARSRGVAAIAVPSATAWREEWAALLAGRQVTIIMDCDVAGRRAAAQIASQLRGVAAVDEVYLDPNRSDGYDLSDRLGELPGWDAADGLQRLVSFAEAGSSQRATTQRVPARGAAGPAPGGRTPTCAPVSLQGVSVANIASGREQPCRTS